MKLWTNWCKKVEEHNKPLLDDWCFHEEVWNPFEIFIPFIVGTVLGLLYILMSGNIIGGSIGGFVVGLLYAVMMFCNWKAYS